MDAETLKESVGYELLTQAVYQAILLKEGFTTKVLHNQSILGRSGVKHQVDVYWEFSQAAISHNVLVECKNYASDITLEKVRNFFAVLHDTGASRGIMVAKTGYQEGVEKFAKYYNIKLMLLRKPNEEDWNGKIRGIDIKIDFRYIRQNPKITIKFASEDDKEAFLLFQSQNPGKAFSSRLLDGAGSPKGLILNTLISNKLFEDKAPTGGPYRKGFRVDDDVYLELKNGLHAKSIKIASIDVLEFYIDSLPRDISLDASRIVEAILKDNETGNIEHWHKS